MPFIPDEDPPLKEEGFFDGLRSQLASAQEEAGAFARSGGTYGPLGIPVSPKTREYQQAPVSNIAGLVDMALDKAGIKDSQNIFVQGASAIPKVGAKLIDSLATPENVTYALMAGPAGGGIPVARMIAGSFAPVLGVGAYEKGKEGIGKAVEGDYAGAGEDFLETAALGVLGGEAAKAAVPVMEGPLKPYKTAAKASSFSEDMRNYEGLASLADDAAVSTGAPEPIVPERAPIIPEPEVPLRFISDTAYGVERAPQEAAIPLSSTTPFVHGFPELPAHDPSQYGGAPFTAEGYEGPNWKQNSVERSGELNVEGHPDIARATAGRDLMNVGTQPEPLMLEPARYDLEHRAKLGEVESPGLEGVLGSDRTDPEAREASMIQEAEGAFSDPDYKVAEMQRLKDFNVPLEEWETLPDDVKTSLKDVMDQAPDKERKHIGKNISDMYHLLGENYGALGGDLHASAVKGESNWQKLRDTASPAIDFIEDAVNEIPEGQRKPVMERVIKAVENRKQADSILRTTTEKDIYQAVTKLFDFFAGERSKLGMKNLPDYFTHVTDTVQNPEKLLTETGMEKLPDEIRSKFNEQRKGSINYSKDLPDVLRRYTNSMGRFLSYHDMINFYNDKFVPEVRKRNLDPYQHKLHQRYVQRFFDFDPMTYGDKVISGASNNFVRGKLLYAPISSLKNMTQRAFARAKVSMRGARAGAIIRSMADENPKLKEFLDGVHEGLSLELTDPSSMKKERGKGLFGKVEEGNWRWARAYGMGEEIAQSKTFREAIRSGSSTKQALELAMKNDKLMARAARRGETLGHETQFSNMLASLPELQYVAKTRARVLRPFTMLTRFSTALPEMIYRNMKSDAKAMSIIKRGVSEEASLAEKYMANRETVKVAKKAYSQAKDAKLRTALGDAITALEKDQKVYKKYINQVEKGPLKTKMLMTVAAVTATNAGLDTFWRSLGDELRKALGIYERKPLGYTDYLQYNAPLGNIALGGGKLSSPLIPNLSSGGSKASWRGLIRTGVSIAPGPLKYLESMFPGNLVSDSIIDALDLEPER
jgi:hypothetical protein